MCGLLSGTVLSRGEGRFPPEYLKPFQSVSYPGEIPRWPSFSWRMPGMEIQLIKWIFWWRYNRDWDAPLIHILRGISDRVVDSGAVLIKRPGVWQGKELESGSFSPSIHVSLRCTRFACSVLRLGSRDWKKVFGCSAESLLFPRLCGFVPQEFDHNRSRLSGGWGLRVKLPVHSFNII